jgi:hypothetical protein
MFPDIGLAPTQERERNPHRSDYGLRCRGSSATFGLSQHVSHLSSLLCLFSTMCTIGNAEPGLRCTGSDFNRDGLPAEADADHQLTSQEHSVAKLSHREGSLPGEHRRGSPGVVWQRHRQSGSARIMRRSNNCPIAMPLAESMVLRAFRNIGKDDSISSVNPCQIVGGPLVPLL